MRLRGKAAASWRILLSVLTLTAAVQAKDDPTIKVTTIKHPPLNLNYFEDSNIILYQDVSEQNLYRTEDAGVTWDKVKDIPDNQASLLTMHEFDKSRAYVITEGTEHFKTTDRGKTWQKFSSGAPPNIFAGETSSTSTPAIRIASYSMGRLA
ncbi:vacuolar protein sorting/targeting protein PEP1 [Colletotrichum tofieldiae]|nr:vacuolar protein sorting/targeting protein PEP1 [Colletotrichum tofieldiae]GKT83033.1 vacuolar protein sorting/targeting protein PEP1 [Colletotrichum tofieldiae]